MTHLAVLCLPGSCSLCGQYRTTYGAFLGCFGIARKRNLIRLALPPRSQYQVPFVSSVHLRVQRPPSPEGAKPQKWQGFGLTCMVLKVIWTMRQLSFVGLASAHAYREDTHIQW